MNLIVLDLDMTLIDTRELVESGGKEPIPGTPEHEAWVKHVTNPKLLAAAPAVTEVLRYCYSQPTANLVFITSRRESTRLITQTWLDNHLLNNRLYMRQDGDLRSSGEFKAEVIQSLTNGPVLVIDDDPDSSVEAACRKHGWTHFKPTTYRSSNE